MEWNESNTDLKHPFLKEAVKQKKWAFVSDFIRIQKLVEFGGVYLDTDMLFIKVFDLKLLEYQYFLGMEDSQNLNAAVIGSVKDGEFLCKIFQFYKKIDQFEYEKLSIPTILSSVFNEFYGIKITYGPINGGLILSYPVFYPLPFKLKNFHWRKFVVEETLAVHLWAGSWIANSEVLILESWIQKIKYFFSKYYVPRSFLKYARTI